MKRIEAKDFKKSMMNGFDILKRPQGNPHGRKKGTEYLDCVCAFDIETSTINDINFMYIWQFQIDLRYTVIGRTWQEFRDFTAKLIDWLDGRTLVIYDHNLSYEFQYLRSLYSFHADGSKDDNVFATERRKILKCVMWDCLEFRCSYFLTNMSLGTFLKKMNVEHQKQDGEKFNYKKVRYPWTKIDWNGLDGDYVCNDVIGLVEAIKAQMARDGDTLYTIPLTSTGYPRRDMKLAMKQFNHRRLEAMQPSLEVYQLLREAFRGGNTHGNRYYAGHIVGNVRSADRSSSYPDVLCNCEFPMGPWIDWKTITDHDIQTFKRLLDRQTYALLFTISFTDLHLSRESWGCPYISKDKCSTIENGVFDNGRVLECDYCEMTITDVDFRIILSEYDFTGMNIGSLYMSKYGKLPSVLVYVIEKYYDTKTRLKGIEDDFSKLMYDKSKNLLNGLYGMMAQDPIKNSIYFNGEEFYGEENKDKEKALLHNSWNASLNYAWGVWTTAWARYRLEEGIRIAESVPDSFIYCDTDSVKYIDQGQNWDEYNEIRRSDSRKNEAWSTDSKGIDHYMGVYEPDGYYDQFITLGAKRYAYMENKKLHLTISGVSKIKGAKELKTLKNFHDGFVFKRSGKTESCYVDHPDQKYIEIGKQKRRIEITSYVLIKDTTYTMGLSYEYKNLLAMIQND